MTRPNRKGRNDAGAKHVRLYRHLFNSAAYRDMDAKARCALHELMFRYDGKNNGAIVLSVRECAERLGVSPNTAMKALQSVVDHGFTCPLVKGSFTLKARHATEWLVTEFGHPTADDPAPKDYRNWDPKNKTQYQKLRPSVLKIATVDGRKSA